MLHPSDAELHISYMIVSEYGHGVWRAPNLTSPRGENMNDQIPEALPRNN
jgi:hypothetical protein